MNEIKQSGSKPQQTTKRKSIAVAGMVALSLLVGFVLAVILRAILLVMHSLSTLIWDFGASAVATPDFPYPLFICALGGLLIGLWNKYSSADVASLQHVLGTVKKTGGFKLQGGWKAIVSFALPLVFGGAVGPEAGLSGLIAHGCTAIKERLMNAGYRIKTTASLTVSAALTAIFGAPLFGVLACSTRNEGLASHFAVSDEALPAFNKPQKIVLYCAAALGSFTGLAAFSALFGSLEGLPHLPHAEFDVGHLVWILASLAIAYVLAWVYLLAERGTEKLSELLGERPVIKALICGIALGAVACVLPMAIFSGEEQLAELVEIWPTQAALVLLLTAAAKAVLTPLCLSFGWKGGHLFPCIFIGACCGYAVALFSAADPVIVVSATSACFLCCIQRKPLLVVALLLLCFPVETLPFVIVSAYLGALLPFPKRLLGESAPQGKKPEADNQS